MFEKTKELDKRVHNLENRLSANYSFQNKEFDYSMFISTVERLQGSIKFIEKELTELKEFLKVERHRPKCDPYLRYKEEEKSEDTRDT